MVGTHPYTTSDITWAWGAPETLIRDFDGNGTKDETNPNTRTYWHIPVKLSNENQVTIVKKRILHRHYGGRNRFHTVNRGAWDIMELTFTGPFWDLSLLEYLTDGVVTTGAAPKYTHVVGTGSTFLAPKTFEMIHKMKSLGSGADILELYIGCICTSLVIGGTVNEQLQATWTVLCANKIVATDLTTPGWPALPTLQLFHMAQSVLTFTLAGTAQYGRFDSFEFSYTTNKALTRGGGSALMESVDPPTEVKISLALGFDEWEDLEAVVQLDPTAANNLDVSIKTSRNTTTDYFTIDFADCFGDSAGRTFVNGKLQHAFVFEYNDKEASGAITITEVNALDDGRY